MVVEERIKELEAMKAWVRDHPSKVDGEVWQAAIDWLNIEIAELKASMRLQNAAA